MELGSLFEGDFLLDHADPTVAEARPSGTDSLVGLSVNDSAANDASPWALGNVALVVQYFIMGLITSFYGVPTTYWLCDQLSLSADAVVRYNIMLSLPECVRVLFSLLVLPWPMKALQRANINCAAS